MLIDQPMLIIAGAQKSGTSTLFEMLAKHPSVSGCTPKEPQFFSMGADIVEENIDWYLSLFEHNSKAEYLLDGSAFYLFHPRTPRLIKDTVSAPKIIIIIRDPAKRMHSAYLHMRKKVPTTEYRSFDDILDQLVAAQNRGESPADAETLLLQNAARDGRVDEKYLDAGYLARSAGAPFDSEIQDPIFLYKYLQNSQYSTKIENYDEHFGRENVKVLFFEELIQSPDTTIRTVTDFAGLEYREEITALSHANKTVVPRGTLGRVGLDLRNRLANSSILSRLYASMTPALRPINQFVSQRLLHGPKTNLSQDQYKVIRQMLDEEYSYWKRRRPESQRLWMY